MNKGGAMEPDPDCDTEIAVQDIACVFGAKALHVGAQKGYVAGKVVRAVKLYSIELS